MGGVGPSKWLDITGKDGFDIHKLIDDYMDELEKETGVRPDEWAIVDSDNVPSAFGENPNLDELGEYASADEEKREAFGKYIDYRGAETKYHEFDDKYVGEFKSEADFMEDTFGDEIKGKLGDELVQYFNWEAYADAEFINTYLGLDSDDNNVFVFSRR